jgi:hypothetical protein
MKVVDTNLAFIKKSSRCKYIPNDGEQGLVDRPGVEHSHRYTSGQGMLVQTDVRPGRTQAHMFLRDASGGIAARVEGTQRGHGGTNTWGEA